MKRRAWWIVIFLLAAALGLSSFWLPAPLDLNAPATSFSAARAFQHIQQIAKAPHPTGSAENARVREYLFKQMRELNLNPREMKGSPNGTPVVNLYGELEGTNKSAPPILLMAHFDTTPRGPGAADDSTGVAVILETIRALKSRGPLRNTIAVLLTDGEEIRGVCLGAHLFVTTQTNLMRDLRVIVNLEARGNRGPVLMFQTGRDNHGLIQLFGASVPLPVAASFSEDIYRRMPNDTDLTEFLNVGKRGYNFAFTAGIEFYHSPQDTPENLSQRTLQHYGACVLPLAANLANADDATLANSLKPGDATFFTICRGLLARYPAAVATILVILTSALFLIPIIRAFLRMDISIHAALASLAVTLLAMSLAALLGIATLYILKRAYKPNVLGPFIVGIPSSAWFLLALLIIVAGATFFIRTKLLNKFRPSENLAGVIPIWLTLAITTNLLLPGASYLFQWPALFAAIALLSPPRLRPILTAAPAALLLAPTILLLHQTITIGLAPLSAALVALTISLEQLGTENSPV
jgi:hypothetical protein